MPRGKKGKTKERVAPNKIARLDIRISGAGGQGIISTGMLLGKSIALGDGRNVSQSQSYGPEARGGATRADIIVSDEEIYFPECNNLNVLVAFTPEAYEKYALLAKPDGIIIADESAVDVLVGSAPTLKVPFLKCAQQKFRRPIVANIIALGFLATYAGAVSRHALRDVVRDEFSGSAHAELNIKALEEGFRLGARYAKDSQA